MNNLNIVWNGFDPCCCCDDQSMSALHRVAADPRQFSVTFFRLKLDIGALLLQ